MSWADGKLDPAEALYAGLLVDGVGLSEAREASLRRRLVEPLTLGEVSFDEVLDEGRHLILEAAIVMASWGEVSSRSRG